MVNYVVASLKHFPVYKILDADARKDSYAYDDYGSKASLRNEECVVDFRKNEAHKASHQNP